MMYPHTSTASLTGSVTVHLNFVAPEPAMTEPEAWRLIAQKICEGKYPLGLYVGALILEHEGRLARGIAQRMHARMMMYCDGTFGCGFSPSDKEPRVLAALLLAEIAEDEAEAA